MSISFNALSKAYGKIQALREVTFTLEPGDVLGYIGPNGAGKSTTMRILTGLIRDYQGSVSIDGRNIETMRDELHRRIGFVPQEAGFQEWRTVSHALRTFGQLSGLSGQDLERRIGAALQRLDLKDVATRRIALLSGGMRQRLRFAQALLHDPDILILDEPLNGLDPASRFQMKKLIKELADGKRYIIFSSHILGEMEDLATRIAILHQGTIKRFGTPEGLRAEFGLGSVIEIESSRRDSLQADWFAGLPVERCQAQGRNRYLLHLTGGTPVETCMPAVMGVLARHDFALSSLRHLQPSLEDVYLALTGEGA